MAPISVITADYLHLQCPMHGVIDVRSSRVDSHSAKDEYLKIVAIGDVWVFEIIHKKCIV